MHQLFMQPHVHARRIVHVAIVFQFFRQLFAVFQAAIETQRLQRIDDRCTPIEVSTALTDKLIHDRLNIDVRKRRDWRRGRRRGRVRRRFGRRGLLIRLRLTEEFTYDVAEDSHSSPQKIKELPRAQWTYAVLNTIRKDKLSEIMPTEQLSNCRSRTGKFHENLPSKNSKRWFIGGPNDSAANNRKSF
ncbi:hypothetical protein BDI4_580004 [Burkholderia diffusa]|nr:hypothetical protein BDI4_580004 [Burkholderia diffusa]